MKSKIAIRKAKVEDAEELCNAEKFYARTPGLLVSHPEELKAESFKKTIRNLSESENGNYIVAVSDDQIVGHAFLDPLPLRALQHVVRLTIVTHPGSQGKGIGRAMLSHLIEWAKANPGIEKIELLVRATNTGAIKLYREFGFLKEGRFSKRIKTRSDYIDDIAMALVVKN